MPYFNLFKKAKKLIPELSLLDHKPLENGAIYIFKIKDYTVTLTITKENDTKTSIWKREFVCDCRASIRGTVEMCSHSLACLVWLVNN